MLNFNINKDANAPSPSAWKVLILDSTGQKIMAPIMKVNELREAGVTLYLYNLWVNSHF